MNGAEHLLSETEIDRALGYPDEVFASEKEILKLLRAQHAKTLALCSERRAREMAMLRAQVEARMPEIAELADNHRTTELN